MQQPLVSILIPLYNSEKYIAETLQSALGQSWPNKEIVVVDDGSTDKSYEIAKSFESDVVKVYNQENKGACAARNKAFELSKGDYIQYLDADDLLSPNKIENQLKLFDKFGNDIIVSCQWDRFYIKPEEAKFPKRFLDKDWANVMDWLLASWEGKGMAQTSVWLTNKNLIEKAGKWNESLAINQDGEFFCRVLLQVKGIKFCPEAKVYYRSGLEASVSQQLSKNKVASRLLSYKLYEKHILQVEDSLRVRHALMINYAGFVYSFYYKYPELGLKAKERIKQLGFKNIEPVGGRNFKLFAKIIGFENALKIRKYIR